MGRTARRATTRCRSRRRLTAGTTSIQAGGFSPFTMTMSREDGEQNLQSIQLHMPPGLLGTLSTVKLCGEPQADRARAARKA